MDEQEFHTLKNELSLLIEFQHFPQKFLEMLEHCSTNVNPLNNSFRENLNDVNINLSKSGTQSNYTCLLHHTSFSESLLIVQEITQFRQLNHLILRIRTASDSQLKKYLTGLVKDFKGRSECYSKENKRLSDTVDSGAKEVRTLKEELAHIKQIHRSELENVLVNHQKETNELKEKLFEENQKKFEDKQRETEALEEHYEKRLQELSKKVEQLSEHKNELEDKRNKLEASEKDLQSKNKILQSELNVYKEEVEKLRKETSSLNTNTFSQEKTLSELKIKNENFSLQIEEKEKQIKNLTQLLENVKDQKSEYEEYHRSLKSSNAKLEDKLQTSISEINKGNEIIQKLQTDIKSHKEKLKSKQQAHKSQEQLLRERQVQLDEANRVSADLRRELDRKDEELRNSAKQIDGYKAKLDEAKKVIEENENVIRFLNKNINDSYQPYRNIIKREANSGEDIYLSTMRNRNSREAKSEDAFASSFAKQPHFNSNFFQTQEGNAFQSSGGQFNMVMPDTNFTNYKKGLGRQTEMASGQANSTNSLNTNFETTSKIRLT